MPLVGIAEVACNFRAAKARSDLAMVWAAWITDLIVAPSSMKGAPKGASFICGHPCRRARERAGKSFPFGTGPKALCRYWRSRKLLTTSAPPIAQAIGDGMRTLGVCPYGLTLEVVGLPLCDLEMAWLLEEQGRKFVIVPRACMRPPEVIHRQPPRAHGLCIFSSLRENLSEPAEKWGQLRTPHG